MGEKVFYLLFFYVVICRASLITANITYIHKMMHYKSIKIFQKAIHVKLLWATEFSLKMCRCFHFLFNGFRCCVMNIYLRSIFRYILFSKGIQNWYLVSYSSLLHHYLDQVQQGRGGENYHNWTKSTSLSRGRSTGDPHRIRNT